MLTIVCDGCGRSEIATRGTNPPRSNSICPYVIKIFQENRVHMELDRHCCPSCFHRLNDQADPLKWVRLAVHTPPHQDSIPAFPIPPVLPSSDLRGTTQNSSRRDLEAAEETIDVRLK